MMMARRYSTGGDFERSVTCSPSNQLGEQWSSAGPRPAMSRATSVSYLFTPKTIRGLGAMYVIKDRCRHANGLVYRSSSKAPCHAIGKAYTWKPGSSRVTEDEWKRAEDQRAKRNSALKDELDHSELTSLSVQMASKEYIAEMRKRKQELVDEVNASQVVPVLNKDRHRAGIEDDISDEDMLALSKSLRASAKRRPMLFGVRAQRDQADGSIRSANPEDEDGYPDFRMSVYKSELVRGSIKSLDDDLENDLLCAAKDVMPEDVFVSPWSPIDSENSEIMQVLENTEQTEKDTSSDIVTILDEDPEFRSTVDDHITHEDMASLSKSIRDSVKRRPMLFAASTHGETHDHIASGNPAEDHENFPDFRMSVYKSELVRGSIQIQGDDLEEEFLNAAKELVQDRQLAAPPQPSDLEAREAIPVIARGMEDRSRVKDTARGTIEFEDIPADHSFLIPTSYHAYESNNPVELIPLSLFEPMSHKRDYIDANSEPQDYVDAKGKPLEDSSSDNLTGICESDVGPTISVHDGLNLINNSASEPVPNSCADSEGYNHNVYEYAEQIDPSSGLDVATSDSDVIKLVDIKNNRSHSNNTPYETEIVNSSVNGLEKDRYVVASINNNVIKNVDDYYERTGFFSSTRSDRNYTGGDENVKGNNDKAQTVVDNMSPGSIQTSNDILNQTFESHVSDSAPLIRSAGIGRSSIGMAGIYGSSKTFIVPNSLDGHTLNSLHEDAETTRDSDMSMAIEMESFSSDTPLLPSSDYSINSPPGAYTELETSRTDVTDSTISFNETNELNVSLLI